MAVQVAAGQVLNPCNDVGPGKVASSESVDMGSEITDVGPEVTAEQGGSGQPFDIKWSDGSILASGCVFKGGDYAPDRSSGLIAGTLTCDQDVVRECFRPVNNLATTCGNGPTSDCGKLGTDCANYWQLIATCRI